MLMDARSALRPFCVFHSSLAAQSGRPIVSHSRAHIRAELAAMLICPSLVGKTPVGIPVGWSLPACGASKPHEGRVPGRVLQVQAYRAFVAVEVLEIETVTISGDVLAFGRRRFDANDIGAPVCQVAHAGRTGACERQVQQRDAAERKA